MSDNAGRYIKEGIQNLAKNVKDHAKVQQDTEVGKAALQILLHKKKDSKVITSADLEDARNSAKILFGRGS